MVVADEAQFYDEALTAYTQGEYQNSYLLLKEQTSLMVQHQLSGRHIK